MRPGVPFVRPHSAKEQAMLDRGVPSWSSLPGGGQGRQDRTLQDRNAAGGMIGNCATWRLRCTCLVPKRPQLCMIKRRQTVFYRPRSFLFRLCRQLDSVVMGHAVII